MTEQQLLRMAKRRLAILCRQDCPGHSYRPTVTRHGREGNGPFPATSPLAPRPRPGCPTRRLRCKVTYSLPHRRKERPDGRAGHLWAGSQPAYHCSKSTIVSKEWWAAGRKSVPLV